jgi:hypothetical protein
LNQAEYSDIAIETAVFIRQVFHLPLRQTEGFMDSLARVMKAEITIPDFSSISKRSIIVYVLQTRIFYVLPKLALNISIIFY